MNTLKTLGFKRHLMTAISFFLPVICAAGFLLAIGNIMGGESIDDFSQTFSLLIRCPPWGDMVLVFYL